MPETGDTHSQRHAPPRVGGPAAGPDVLVVEDDPVINELVGAYARLAGFGYRGATSGEAALAEVRRRPPALIVLDLMLPDLDGFEVCRRVKGAAESAGVPVVMLTALDDDDYRARGFACGASEYLTKPFDPDQLIDIMTRYVHSEAAG